MISIRPATEKDAFRIAEILVFNNRLFYFPIFGSEEYSFGEMQVLPVAGSYLDDRRRLAGTYVADERGIVKGFFTADGDELLKLYVEPSFQSEGVGASLLSFAVSKLGVTSLWALEKNVRARAFYRRHGFCETGLRQLEEGTEEYLVLMTASPTADRKES